MDKNCGNCIHWEQKTREITDPKQNAGHCTTIVSWSDGTIGESTDKRGAVMWPEKAFLLTDKDFSCALHQSKSWKECKC